MIEDLSIKASRAIFAIKSRIKLGILPIKLAKIIFQCQIMPILLYGSEIWGPYTNHDYITWDKTKVEQVQTQFLKQVLGCNFQTSNLMARADTGTRPLLNAIIKRTTSYAKSFQYKNANLCYDAYEFEMNNSELPNFFKFTDNFNMDIRMLIEKSHSQIDKMCNENYNCYWNNHIRDSSKASAFIQFKTNIFLETYLKINYNRNHKKTITRFRLSNHSLMIEKGRHLKIERNERICYFCTGKIEDEENFFVNSPLYCSHRKNLEEKCIENCNRYAHLNDKQKFIFLMSNEDIVIIKALGRYLSDSTKIRDKIIEYFFT